MGDRLGAGRVRAHPRISRPGRRSSDKHESARFLAGILGVPVGQPLGPFVPVTVGNRVTLDFADHTEFHAQHCAATTWSC